MSVSDAIPREQWATHIGFILAAVGSAVGLGNIWRFPFQVGQEGGAAFLVIYLLLVFGLGLPAMLVEFVIGRRAERNPINAFRRLGYSNWTFIGVIGVGTGFIILSYYSVVAGWVLRYVIGSATGAYFGAPQEYFLGIASGTDALLFHAVFMLITAGIVAFGIQRGIELSVKLMVPAIYVLLIGLAVYAFTLGGAAQGYAYYLSPDVGTLSENWTSILPAAVGQALFTLSLGMGVMITYSSYLGEDRNLGVDGVSITLLNTLVSFIAGLVIFPIVFTIGNQPGEGGAGELFINVAAAFGDIPLGSVAGVIFFGTIAIAALSSAISILEVVVSFLIDNFELERKRATFAVAGAAFLLGIPTAFDMATLELYDQVVAELLLPLGLLLMVVFVGWVYDEAVDELGRGIADIGPYGEVWHWHVRVVILIVIAITLVLGVQELVTSLG